MLAIGSSSSSTDAHTRHAQAGAFQRLKSEHAGSAEAAAAGESQRQLDAPVALATANRRCSGRLRLLRVGCAHIVTGRVNRERRRAETAALALVALAVGGLLTLPDTLELLGRGDHLANSSRGPRTMAEERACVKASLRSDSPPCCSVPCSRMATARRGRHPRRHPGQPAGSGLSPLSRLSGGR